MAKDPNEKEKGLVGTIDPNLLDTRDPLMVHIINGVTKAGIHKDRKKEANRKACRNKVDMQNEGE
jgi:hypothetical protein